MSLWPYELPVDPPIDTETPVDQEKVAAEQGCTDYHRQREECSSDGAFPASSVAMAVEFVLGMCEQYDMVYRAPFVEQVIAGLKEEMGK